jgi:hypothetical protein
MKRVFELLGSRFVVWLGLFLLPSTDAKVGPFYKLKDGDEAKSSELQSSDGTRPRTLMLQTLDQDIKQQFHPASSLPTRKTIGDQRRLQRSSHFSRLLAGETHYGGTRSRAEGPIYAETASHYYQGVGPFEYKHPADGLTYDNPPTLPDYAPYHEVEYPTDEPTYDNPRTAPYYAPYHDIDDPADEPTYDEPPIAPYHEFEYEYESHYSGDDDDDDNGDKQIPAPKPVEYTNDAPYYYHPATAPITAPYHDHEDEYEYEYQYNGDDDDDDDDGGEDMVTGKGCKSSKSSKSSKSCKSDNYDMSYGGYKPKPKPTSKPKPKPAFKPKSTPKPTYKPTPKPTYEFTQTYTYKPTQTSTYDHTQTPTYEHMQTFTYKPTYEHTQTSTYKPTYKPTYEHTQTPTYKPTYEPTYKPTYERTQTPTYKPTYESTYKPTYEPTQTPVRYPTKAPFDYNPTQTPTYKPTQTPYDYNPTQTPVKYPTKAPYDYKPPSQKEYLRFVMVREEAGTPVPGYFGIGDSLALNGQIYYWEGSGDKYVSDVPSGSFVAICTGVTSNDDLLCTYEIILRLAKADDTASGVGVLVATGPNYYEENDMIVTGTEFDFAKYVGGTLVTVEDTVQPYLYATLYLI